MYAQILRGSYMPILQYCMLMSKQNAKLQQYFLEPWHQGPTGSRTHLKKTKNTCMFFLSTATICVS